MYVLNQKQRYYLWKQFSLNLLCCFLGTAGLIDFAGWCTGWGGGAGMGAAGGAGTMSSTSESDAELSINREKIEWITLHLSVNND